MYGPLNQCEHGMGLCVMDHTVSERLWWFQVSL